MTRTIYFLCWFYITIISINSFGQSTWKKEERNTIFDESVDFLRKYPNLTKEQKENLSLCYLDELTKKYTHNEFKEKIDIEIRKIRESILSICAKNQGVIFSEEAVSESKEPLRLGNSKPENTSLEITKENLTGRWKDQVAEYWFFGSGDCRLVYNGGIRVMGTWSLIGRTLYIKRERSYKTEREMKIIGIKGDRFAYRVNKINSDVIVAQKVVSNTN